MEAGARRYSLEFREGSTQMTDGPDDTDPKKRKLATGEPSGLCCAGLGYRCATENEMSKVKLSTVSGGRCTAITFRKGSDRMLDTHSEEQFGLYHIIRQREREGIFAMVGSKRNLDMSCLLLNSV